MSFFAKHESRCLHGLLAVCLLFSSSSALEAQQNSVDDTGVKAYEAYTSGQFDHVNLSSGDVTLLAPLLSYPQQGDLSLNFSIRANNRNWYVSEKSTPATHNGSPNVLEELTWRGSGVNITTDDDWQLVVIPSQDSTVPTIPNITDGTGATHPMIPIREPSGGYTATDYMAGDGAGIRWRSGGAGPQGVITRAGVAVQGLTEYNVQYPHNSYSLTDVDGNSITRSISYNQSSNTATDNGWTDSLGRTIPGGVFYSYKPSSYSNSTGGAFQPWVRWWIPGTPTSVPSQCPSGTTSANAWSPPLPGGQTGNFYFCFSTIQLKTAFGMKYRQDPTQANNYTPIAEISQNEGFITAIILPPAKSGATPQSWAFSYDSYGDLQSVTSPLGAVVSYGWVNGPPVCDTGYTSTVRLLSSRTVDAQDGRGAKTWNYAYGYSGGPTTTETDPDGNDVVHTFTYDGNCQMREVSTSWYNGSASSGKVLKTIGTQYVQYGDTNWAYGYFPQQITTTLFSNGGGGASSSSQKLDTYDHSNVGSFTLYTDSGGNAYAGSGSEVNVSLGNKLVETVQDFGSSTVLTTDVLNPQWLANSAYLTSNLLDLPASTQKLDSQSAQAELTTYTYDETTYSAGGGTRGHVTSVDRWNNLGTDLITHNGWNTIGQKTYDLDALNNRNGNGHTNDYKYDDCGGAMLSSTINALGQTAAITHDCVSGQVGTSTDLNSSKTLYTQYDAFGRVGLVSYPDGGSTTYTYNDSQHSVQADVAGGTSPDVVHVDTLDGLGRLLTQSIGGITVTTTYDDLGRVGTVSNPGSTTDLTTHHYDTLGRPIQVVNQDSSSVTWKYNQNITTFTDEASHAWLRTTDALNRLVAVVEPGSLNTTYQYDALSNLRCVDQWANSNPGTPCSSALARSFTYDSLSRIVKAYNPETGSICYGTISSGSCQAGYDANGNVLHKTDANSTTTSYSYDALDRITSVNAPGTGAGTNSVVDVYVYDAEPSNSGVATAPNSIGKLVWTSNGIDTDRHYQYDVMGRPILMEGCTPYNCIATGDPVNVRYDLAGNSIEITYPSGRSVQRSFDRAGRLYQIQDVTQGSSGPVYLAVTSFWPSGQVQSENLGGELSMGVGLNSRLQLSGFNVNSAALPSASPHSNVYDETLSYASPNNGNISSIVDNLITSRTQSFGYDGLNRITSAMRNDGAYNHNYNYDSFGNMLLQDNLQGTPNYSRDPAATNRILLNNNNLQYDLAGRLTADPFHSYGYNAAGMLSTIDSGNTARYSYHQGYRTGKTTGSGWTDYIYFEGQPLAEQDNSGAWTDYVYAGSKKIAKVVTNASSLNLHGTRDSSINMNCGVEGPVSGAGAVGYTIQSGDRLVMSVKQTLPTYGGLALVFTSGTGSGSLTDIATGTPFYFDGVADGTWHTMVGDLTPFAGQKISYVLAGIHNSAPSGTFDLNMKDAVLQTVAGTTLQILIGQAATVVNFSGTQCGGYNLSSGAVSSPVVYPDNTNYYVADQIGSTQVEVTATGLPLYQGQFTPFGQEIIGGTTSNTFGYQADGAATHYKFTGKERDQESGLDYFGARYYSSAAGRFSSPDWTTGPEPVPYASLGNPQSLNLYSYAHNMPLTASDPDGHDSENVVGDGYDPVNGTLNPFSNHTPGGNSKPQPCPVQACVTATVPSNKFTAIFAALAAPLIRTYQTYLRPNLDGGVPYVGRTSGFGTALQNIMKRMRYNPKTGRFGVPQLDKSSPDPDAIRGREQNVMEKLGGARSDGGTSSNAIRGVARGNTAAPRYCAACEQEFPGEMEIPIEVTIDIP